MRPHPPAGRSVTVTATEVFLEDISPINSSIVTEFIHLEGPAGISEARCLKQDHHQPPRAAARQNAGNSFQKPRTTSGNARWCGAGVSAGESRQGKPHISFSNCLGLPTHTTSPDHKHRFSPCTRNLTVRAFHRGCSAAPNPSGKVNYGPKSGCLFL